MSLKFVPKDPNNNIPALVHIVPWRQPGTKLLSKPMMVRLPNSNLNSKMIYYSKSTYYNINPQLKEYIDEWTLMHIWVSQPQ